MGGIRRLAAIGAATLAVAMVGTGVAAAEPPTEPFVMNLVNADSGLCLTGTNEGYDFAVLQLPCNGSEAQQWQSAPDNHYLMDLQFKRCIAALPNTSQVKTYPCWWKNGQPYDPKQGWGFAQGSTPTRFSNDGLCLGILPGNSWIRRLDCNSGARVTWYR
ncbi:hypothetical protein GCM10009554_50040 [Kribbella koreensis]|uniref:Ricin B lectin domain-containing protein n=2 Tax=Kribbella TaxID=182639 RepID=A0ABP6Z4V5_9ACTN